MRFSGGLMKTYLEVKETICKIFRIDSVDESSDIVLVSPRNERNNDNSLVIKNDELKEAYDNYTSMKEDQLQLYGLKYFEMAVQVEWFPRRDTSQEWLEDSVNKVAYQIGTPSTEYFIMLMDRLTNEDIVRNRISMEATMHLSFILKPKRPEQLNVDLAYILSRVFHIQAIRIRAEINCTLTSFENYVKAYEFLYMFKTRRSLVEVTEIDTLLADESGGIARSTRIDEPPRRKVKPEILEFYSMAIEARDPFTKYISYYHVVEYFFDEVYKSQVIAQMRNMITDPGFSYKSDKNIYDLAKFANKKMKNDDQNGRGNEFESLKYVLSEYVPIDSLKVGLTELNSTLVQYYAEKNVSFAGAKNKITWNDSVGVYTSIAKRVYETRNALVHTKSDQSEKQYKPQKHRELLKKEIPLIQVIAEKVITATSTVL